MLTIFICVFVVWYFYFSLECFLNGGTLGRNQFLAVFQCYWEEFLWHIPGGSSRKIQFVKNIIGKRGVGCIIGKRKSWEYGDVRSGNLYQECANDVLSTRWEFLLSNAVVLIIGVIIGGVIQKMPLIMQYLHDLFV